LKRKSVVPLAYMILAGFLLCSPAFIPQARTASASSGSGKRTGVYIAASQASYPEPYSPASSFVSGYESAGLFDTILIYAQCSSPCSVSTGDFSWTLQLMSSFDSVPNFKGVVDVGFNLLSSSDWSAVQTFIGDLASHPSVGWVGIEGEHTTYDTSGCEFSGSCQSVGEAWNNGQLSQSQLQSYFSQFDNMVTGDGLQVAHYYVTFGGSAWADTQQSVYVAQWPACGPGADVSNCNQADTQTAEIQGGTTSNFIGISAGLSTNVANYWNPTVSGTSNLDDLISTYINVAEQQPASSRQLILFETGAYGYIGDQWRSIFTADLANAMAQYSDFVYPSGSPGATTTTYTTSSAPATTTFFTTTTFASSATVTKSSTAVTLVSTTATTTTRTTSVLQRCWHHHCFTWNLPFPT
jgi:hypothetical protein